LWEASRVAVAALRRGERADAVRDGASVAVKS
jgi:hypothetical protein